MSPPDPFQDPISAELLEHLERIPQEVDRSFSHRKEQTRVQSILYLIPFAGFVPAIWRLYHPSPKTDRSQRQSQEAAQLAVSTGGLWAIVMVLLTLGNISGQSGGENIGITPLVLASLLTSGYFLTNVWLMIQILRRQRMYLPGLSEVGQRLVYPRRKHRP
jgi:hypothetical protein